MGQSAGNWTDFSKQRPEFAHAERVWRDVLEPELSKRERERSKIVNGTIRKTALIIAGVALVVGGASLLISGGIGAGLQFGVFSGMATAAGFTGFDWIKVFSMKTRSKELILGAAAAPFGFRYDTLHPDVSGITDLNSLKAITASISEQMEAHPLAVQFGYGNEDASAPTPAYEILKQARLLPKHNSTKFEDLIDGRRAGAAFSLVEAKLTDTSGDNDTVEFQGLLLHVEYPQRFQGRTLIARRGWRKGWFSDDALKRVELVSSELDRAFRVYSTDQVEARALLTPDRMERLIALERHFDGGDLRAVFEDGHLTLALDADDQFEGGSIFKTLVDPMRFIGALTEMGLVCDLVDGFLTREWAKDKLGH